MDRDVNGNVVEPVVVGSIATYAPAAPGFECTGTPGHAVAIAGPGETAQSDIYSFAGRWPSAVTLANHVMVVAYFSESSGRVAVKRLTPVAPAFWNELDTTFLTTSPASTAGGVSVNSAPDLAVGPDGRLHLVYTVQDPAGDTDVVYRYSDDGGVNWSDAVSVADPAAEGANQFLPAIAVGPTNSATLTGGRAEVVYLDDRDPGSGYRPFLTAFARFSGDAAPTRGANRPLDAAVQSVSGAGVGSRLAVLGTPDAAAPSGAAFVWWPASTGTAKLYRSKLNHGSEPPVLANGTVGTSKNVPVGVPDLLAATDGDGDPVRVSMIAAPTHGSMDGTTYKPATGYAGPDVMTLLADDGQPRASIQRQIAIANAAPVMPDVKTPLRVPQGGSRTLQLNATDADPNDQLRYELVPPLPSQLANSVVTVTEDGLLTVRPSKTARSTSILDVRVRVSDTSPLVGGTREALVPVKIDPQYTPFTVLASFTGTRNTAKFTAEVEDQDQEWETSRRSFEWDFGDKTSHDTRPSPKHTYVNAGVYTWHVTVTITRAEGSVSVTQSGQIMVTEAGIKVLRLKQAKVNRKKQQVTLKLRSQIAGEVQISLKAGKYSIKPKKITLRPHKDLSVTLSTRALHNPRSASLVVKFIGGVAGPLPTPVYASIRLR